MLKFNVYMHESERLISLIPIEFLLTQLRLPKKSLHLKLFNSYSISQTFAYTIYHRYNLSLRKV